MKEELIEWINKNYRRSAQPLYAWVDVADLLAFIKSIEENPQTPHKHPMNNNPFEEKIDWRKSDKANELREYIDSSFKQVLPGMTGLGRELIIDFAAKERETALTQQREHIAGEVEKIIQEERYSGAPHALNQVLQLLQTPPRNI